MEQIATWTKGQLNDIVLNNKHFNIMAFEQ